MSAEAPGRPKWLWILIIIVLVALPLIWWASDADNWWANEEEATSAEIIGAETPEADAITPPEPVAREAGISIADILANPSEFVGRNDFQDEVTVPEVQTDRAFWIEDQGQRLITVIIDNPREAPKDINQGQQLRITEGMVRDASFLSQLPGTPIDADTRRVIEGQDVFLVVDEADIEILSGRS